MRTTRAFELEMGSLSADYVAYDEMWTGARVAADWPGFCRATRSIFGQLTMRIEREEHELYPLADALHSAAQVLDPAVRAG